MTLTFKIQIRNIKTPPVWRRIEIPATMTFEELHHTIQQAFGWEGYHLYQFQKQAYDGGWSIKSPDELEQDSLAYWGEQLDASKTGVGDFLNSRQLNKFVYVYDFGDDWIHDITLEYTDMAAMLPYPVCLRAKGACPPEDCGGPWGYEGIKELFRESPRSSEAKEYLRWMGLKSVKDFDANAIDIIDINSRLMLLTPKGTRPSKSSLPQKQQSATGTGSPADDFLGMMDQMADMLSNMDDNQREQLMKTMLGITPLPEMENQKFYSYKKPDYEQNIPQTLQWLSPFWNARYEDNKVELCHFVEEDGRRMKMTSQQKLAEMRGYMNMLFARFDKELLENRWKLYGPLWMMEREKMTDCLDLVLEALRQDAYFMHAYIFRYEKWVSAVIYQLGKDQIETLEELLYQQGIIPHAKPIVLNALLWTLIRQPEKRLRITAMLSKFLNHCLDICRQGASTFNLEFYAISLATAHVTETLPILQRIFKELNIQTTIVEGGIDEVARLMNDPKVEFCCKYDSLDQYLNDKEEIEESREFNEETYYGISRGNDYYGEDEDDYDADDLYDIQGIYDLSEPAARYEIRIEKIEPADEPERTIQLPSNMLLDGFAQLIMRAFGRTELPEPYEFEDEKGFRYLSDEETHALDKDYWQMDPTDINTVGILLQKKGETAAFNIRKGKRKGIESYALTLEKKGRYTAKTKQRIDLLKAPGLPQSQADKIRQQLHDFEAENENAIS